MTLVESVFLTNNNLKPKRKKKSRQLIYIGIILGLSYWALESLIHSTLLGDGSFLEELVNPGKHEVWMRSFTVFFLLLFAWFIQIKYDQRWDNQNQTHQSLDTKSETLTQAIDQLQHEMSQRNKAEKELHLFRRLIDQSNEMVFLSDPETAMILYANDKAVMSLGYTHEDFYGLRVTDFDDRLGNESNWENHVNDIKKKQYIITESMFKCKDGSLFPVEINVKFATHKGKSYLIAMVRDISERRIAEENQKLAAIVFDSVTEGIIITDSEEVIQWVNPAFSSVTQYSYEEVIGKKPSILKSGRHDKEFYEKMWASINGSGHWAGEVWNRKKDGEIYPEWLSIVAIKDSFSRVAQYAAVFSDITKRKEYEKLIEFKAYHDPLTELPNRLLFFDRLDLALADAERNKSRFAVLFIDLDGFKLVNDEHGHDTGDELLKMVAEKISGSIRKADTVARLGGDEFIVLLPHLSHVDDGDKIAGKILLSVREIKDVNGMSISISASIGISMYPDNGLEGKILVKKADDAMYVAKQAGKNHYSHYLEGDGSDAEGISVSGTT